MPVRLGLVLSPPLPVLPVAHTAATLSFCLLLACSSPHQIYAMARPWPPILLGGSGEGVGLSW